MNNNILQLLNTPKEELRSIKQNIEEALALQAMLESGYALVLEEENGDVRIIKLNSEIVLRNKKDVSLFTKGTTIVNI